jgi:hypothetical protein
MAPPEKGGGMTRVPPQGRPKLNASPGRRPQVRIKILVDDAIDRTEAVIASLEKKENQNEKSKSV